MPLESNDMTPDKLLEMLDSQIRRTYDHIEAQTTSRSESPVTGDCLKALLEKYIGVVDRMVNPITTITVDTGSAERLNRDLENGSVPGMPPNCS